MNRHYTRYLFKKYAPLYQGHSEPLTQNLMGFGFEHGDGWFNIINALSFQLCGEWVVAKQRYDKIKNRVGELVTPAYKESKYNPIITEELIEECKQNLEAAATKVPKAVQVKEKFGTLRFYLDSSTDEQFALINFAESLSARTCEVCGKPGKPNNAGWIRTLCKEHRGNNG